MKVHSITCMRLLAMNVCAHTWYRLHVVGVHKLPLCADEVCKDTSNMTCNEGVILIGCKINEYQLKNGLKSVMVEWVGNKRVGYLCFKWHMFCQECMTGRKIITECSCDDTIVCIPTLEATVLYSRKLSREKTFTNWWRT